MKTLQTIQTISKIGKIISKIVFICCVVGFCLCVVGIVGLALGVSVMQFGGVSLESLLQYEADMSTGTLYASVICGAILCAGQAVLAKFAQRYFERELKDGTPFTLDGALQLLRLGVLSIGIPVAVQVAAQITQKIVVRLFTDVEPLDADPAVSLTVGALVIVLALVCRYGAEMIAAQTAPESTQAETTDNETR